MEQEVNLECPWNVESLEDFLYYFCPECAERKHSRDDFLNHALSHHPLSNNYLIKFCVKKEQNDEYYYTDIDENHLDIVHNDNKPTEPNPLTLNQNDYDEQVGNIKEETINEDCCNGISLKNEDEYIDENIDENINETSFIKQSVQEKQSDSDYDCGESFSDSSSLKKHNLTFHGGNKDLNCESCGKSFSTISNLKIHIQTIHKGQKDYKCNSCSKSFSRVEQLKKHVYFKHHEGHKDFKCESCGKSFLLAGSLTKHIKYGCHKNFKCDSCSLSFQIKTNLDKHIKKVHEKEEDAENNQFDCDTCGKSFKTKKFLRQHTQRLHDGLLKSHFCNEPGCGKAFKSDPELRRHIERHKGIGKKYLCTTCGKSFHEPHKLKRHMEVHEKKMNGIGKYQCDFENCSETFGGLKLLWKHKQNSHVHDKAKYPCDECNKGFNKEIALKNHIDRVHKKIFSEVCNICGKQLSDKTNFQNHLKIHEKETAETSEIDNTIRYEPDEEFKDSSQYPAHCISKAWIYYLYNEKTKEIKCRFCGKLVHLRPGNLLLVFVNNY